MMEIAQIAECLDASPYILRGMMASIPKDRQKLERLPGRWTLHEHACHVCVGEKFAFHKRFHDFLSQDFPEFKPISGNDFSHDFYLNMSVEDAISEFQLLRTKTIRLITAKTSNVTFWEKKAIHPEYELYTSLIMARHLLMHDHYHFYRIEELWLTKDGMFEA